jgi:hypothetical protein
MAGMIAERPGAVDRTGSGHPILWNGLLFGVISGIVLAANAYYKIVQGQDAAVIAFGALTGVAWLAAGYRASTWAINVRTGALAGLCAALIGAAIGAAVDQALAHEYISQWVAHLVAACPRVTGAATGYAAGYADNCPFGVAPDAQTVLGTELQNTITGLVTLPLVGLLLGFVSGFVGTGRGVRTMVGDEYDFGRKTVDVPLIGAHRSVLPQGDFPLTDKPDF